MAANISSTDLSANGNAPAPIPVPEPGSAAIFGIGLLSAGVGCFRRQRLPRRG
jgi:hypothetical protein